MNPPLLRTRYGMPASAKSPLKDNFSRCAADPSRLAASLVAPRHPGASAALFAQVIFSRLLPACWLLLGQAVQRAETEDEIHGVDADHGTVANQLAEDAEREAVGTITAALAM